jgi:hypothetical protein
VAYASNTDLLGEFKGLSAWNNATLSAAQVDVWCARESAFIDSNIAGKYRTPVSQATSPIAYSMLTDICIWLVRPRIAELLNLQTGEAKSSSSGGGKSYDSRQRAMDVLKQIRTGELKLPDGVLATAQDGVESYTDDNSDTLQPPTFTREGDEW